MADYFWFFLLQTLTASGVAALLLLLKALFRDKLSPRWQFAVWSVLALRLLLPASLPGRYVLFDWPLWTGTLRVLCERGPAWVRTLPSVLGGLCLLGTALALLWHARSYLRLRLALRRGTPAGAEARAALDGVCQAYGLSSCRAVEVEGLPTAFVCGVLRPVLALPAGGRTDEKVLLHELLHYNYRDTAAGLAVCLLRCLHWCNPLLWYCCDRALDDCEALCDQRVLERLEGEARRDYGRILLSMADEKYARAPGTSSMANGAAQVKARIACIARFKRYPRGMALVSACVALMIGLACLAGVPSSALPPERAEGAWASARALAITRLRRCTTVAGALDVYAKALLYGNPWYLATVSPLADGPVLGRTPPNAPETDGIAGFQAVNLLETAPGVWEGLLAFTREQDSGEWYDYAIPVRVYRGDGWQVEPANGPPVSFPNREYPPALETSASAGDYEVRVTLSFSAEVENTLVTEDWFFSKTYLNPAPLPDAAFSQQWTNWDLTLTYTGSRPDFRTLACVYTPLPADWTPGSAPLDAEPPMGGDGSSSSSTGDGGVSRTIHSGWDRTLHAGGGTSRPQEEPPFAPRGFQVDIYEDLVHVQTLYPLIGEVGP